MQQNNCSNYKLNGQKFYMTMKHMVLPLKEKSTHTELMQIMKMRQMAIGNEKQVFTEMLEQKLQNYGLKAKNSQVDLFKG